MKFWMACFKKKKKNLRHLCLFVSWTFLASIQISFLEINGHFRDSLEYPCSICVGHGYDSIFKENVLSRIESSSWSLFYWVESNSCSIRFIAEFFFCKFEPLHFSQALSTSNPNQENLSLPKSTIKYRTSFKNNPSKYHESPFGHSKFSDLHIHTKLILSSSTSLSSKKNLFFIHYPNP